MFPLGQHSFPAPGCGIAIESWMRVWRDCGGVEMKQRARKNKLKHLQLQIAPSRNPARLKQTYCLSANPNLRPFQRKTPFRNWQSRIPELCNSGKSIPAFRKLNFGIEKTQFRNYVIQENPFLNSDNSISESRKLNSGIAKTQFRNREKSIPELRKQNFEAKSP